jgi:phenylalanyl-tRNA synthetase beta chain
VNHLLGTALDAQEVRCCLEQLSLEVTEEEGGALLVRPPTRRVDLTREIDLVEEVARVWGYDRIPATLPRSSMVAAPMARDRKVEAATRESLLGFGFTEIITYAFMDPGAMAGMGLAPEDPLQQTVPLRNPLRVDQGAMRTSLVPGMLDVVRRNLHQKNLELRLFELGRVFLPVAGEVLPREPRRLGGVMLGDRFPAHWGAQKTPVDFFDLKGVVEGLLAALRVPSPSFIAEDPPPFLRKGGSAWVRAGETTLGWMGVLGPEAQERSDLAAAPLLFEWDFEALVALAQLGRRMQPLPRFPEVVRDLSVLVDAGVAAGDVLAAIAGVEVEWLEEAFLVAVFAEGGQLPPGKKSLTFRLRYRSGERSLTDDEVNAQQGRLLRRLEEGFGVRLR